MSEFNGILTLTVFLPALAGLVILLVKPLQLEDRIIRWFAILSTVVTFVLTLVVFLAYDRDAGGVQFIDHLSWLSAETIKSSYLLGVDGLSAPLVLLTGLLGMAAAFASRNIELRVSEYFIWLLLLETAVMGVFVSLDLLLFFVFFEFEVIPMFMLISLWGSGRPRYSAMKFVLYTLAGGAFMFVGIFAVYLTGAVDTLTMVPVPELGIVGIADQIAGVDLIAPASLIFAFFLSRVCREITGLAIAQLVARRPHRRADRGERDACRRVAENGRLRHDPNQHRILSKRRTVSRCTMRRAYCRSSLLSVSSTARL